MAQVNTIDYRFSNYAHRHIMFETLTKLYCASPTVDILWQLLLRFHQQVPNWQGMMHTVHSGSKQPGSPRQSTESYLLQLSKLRVPQDVVLAEVMCYPTRQLVSLSS